MPAGQHVPQGRASRTVLSVDVGDFSAPADADRRFALPAGDEIATLTAVRSLVERAAVPGSDAAGGDPFANAIWARARVLAQALVQGRYVLIVADGERREDLSSVADQARVAALIALAQALNGPTRAALSLLRAGGNRQGAEAVLTAHTGYPAAVDFARGVPRYRPYEGTGAMLAARGDVDAVIVIGRGDQVPTAFDSVLSSLPTVRIGPGASGAGPAHVAIDTGLAGVHEEGTVLRLDDVPLPARAPVPGARLAVSVVKALTDAVVTRRQSRNA
jgi:formylmethanofuran dehydrogenase subunit B